MSDKELCGVLRIKLDRMKDECDKMALQLSTKEEAHALLHRKYLLLKQELDDKVSPAPLPCFSNIVSNDIKHPINTEYPLSCQ